MSTPASNPPLSVGHRLVATISDIAFGGEGVARVRDFVVFVPFVLVDEEVEIEVVEVKKRFARARPLRIVRASSDRVTPECVSFGECGGCQYQHIRYERQVEIKRKQVADLFQRIGGFDPGLVAPLIPCPAPYGYRNRIMIRSQWNRPEQRLSIGFIRWDSGLVTDVRECKISEPEVSARIGEVWANPPPKGGIKVVLRMMPPGWDVPRDAFFQNNFHLLPKLVETVRNRLREAGSRFLVDVYCGVGFFGIELGDLVERFVGAEVDVQAIRAARRNADTHGRNNGEFVVGSAEQLLPELLQRFDPAATTVILDPPRAGCPPDSLELLRRVRPAQILYVSCHPATLARDLNVLCADGVYELRTAVPHDMFPQTQHVECVADLRLRGVKGVRSAG